MSSIFVVVCCVLMFTISCLSFVVKCLLHVFESFLRKFFVVVSIGAFVFGACRVFVGFATVGFRVYALWLRVWRLVACGWGVGVGWGVFVGYRGC